MSMTCGACVPCSVITVRIFVRNLLVSALLGRHLFSGNCWNFKNLPTAKVCGILEENINIYDMLDIILSFVDEHFVKCLSLKQFQVFGMIAMSRTMPHLLYRNMAQTQRDSSTWNVINFMLISLVHSMHILKLSPHISDFFKTLLFSNLHFARRREVVNLWGKGETTVVLTALRLGLVLTWPLLYLEFYLEVYWQDFTPL